MHRPGLRCELTVTDLTRHDGAHQGRVAETGVLYTWGDQDAKLWTESTGQTAEVVDNVASSYQVGGNHYRRAIQPWDIWDVWDLNPWEAQVIKYVLRAGHKKGVPAVQDYKKARHCLDYLIEKGERGRVDNE